MTDRLRAVVAFALVASLLVATAPIAVADHGAVVVSQHTTTSDFEAGTLDNMTATGGTIQISSGADFSDGFEDESADSGTPDDFEVVDSGFDSQSVSTARANSGSQSYFQDGPATGIASVRPSEQPYSTAKTGNFSVALNPDTTSADNSADFRVYEDADRLVIIGFRNGDLSYYNGSWTVLDSSVTTDEWIQLEMSIDPGNNEVTITWNSPSTTEQSQVIVAETTITNGYTDIRLAADENQAYWDDYTIFGTGTGDNTPASYTSPNRTVEQSEQAWFNITENTNATVTIRSEAWNGTGWEQLAEQTGITSTGNLTLSWSPSSFDTVRNVVEVANNTSNGAPAFTMADESVGANASTPVVDNNSANPTGGVSTSTPTLEIDVNDSDFPLAQSDQVQVEFFVGGSSIGTDTLTANGTASQTVSSALTGGDHTWHVVATDEYDHSVTSQTFDISTPGNITIRNVTEPHAVITSATAEVLLAGSGETVDEQTVTDGNISLTGIPTDETYVIIVDAEGYYVRSAVVTDIFDQSSIFLLNDTNKPSVETVFEIEDPTGELEDPLLIIERSINRSQYDSSTTDTYQWTIIGGSRLSATGTLSIILEENALYRLEIRDDGIVYELGEHPASSAGTFTLVPVEPTLNSSDPETDIEYAVFRDSDSIHINFDDPTDNTSTLEVFIHERGNESNTLQPNETYSDLGTLVLEEPLSAVEQNTSWTVVLNYTHDGSTYLVRETLGGASVDTVPVELSPMWLQIGSVMMLVLFAGIFSIHTRGMGAFAVAGMGGVLWHIGWLDPIASGAAVSLALGIGVLAALSQGGQ